MKSTSDSPRRAVPLKIRAAQAIMLVPLGAVVVFGGTYFGFVSPVETMNAAKYAVAVWAIAQGALSLFTATRLGTGRRVYHQLALILMAGHFCFGIVKLVFWQETAAIPFMVLDATVFALVSAAGYARRPDAGSTRIPREGVVYIGGVGLEPTEGRIVIPRAARA